MSSRFFKNNFKFSDITVDKIRYRVLLSEYLYKNRFDVYDALRLSAYSRKCNLKYQVKLSIIDIDLLFSVFSISECFLTDELNN